MKGQERAFGRLAALMVAGLALGLWAGEAGAQTAKKLDCKGCVKSKQIKNRAIKGADIKNKTIGASKIKDESLTGKDIKDGSIGTADLAPEAAAGPTYVFLSSESHDGGFGVAAWDAVCQSDAVAAGLSPGVYQAWLSTSSFDARDMLPLGPFVDTAGSFVALNKADLLNDTILRGIGHFASGVPAARVAVWTGTGPDGTFLAPNCANWAVNDSATQGRIGETTRTDGAWTDVFLSDCNDATRYAYCFQVE